MMLKCLMYGALLLVASLFAGCGSTVAEKFTTSDDLKLVAASKDFPNAGLLVTPESVQSNLNKSGLVIIDARGTGYDIAHVPGAINMKHSDFWTAGVGLKETAVLEDLLGKAGLTRYSKIVIYDNTTAAWGAAGRIFWMLEYLGCTDVHIMNGGWDKWVADGRTVEAARNTLPEKTFTASVKSSVRATSAQIMDRYQDSDFAIIDARTDEEFNGWQLYGEARGGHIPNAVQIPYAWYFASDKTVLNYADMKTMLESRGITRDMEVTSYCTAGIRSGYVYFILRLMGYSKASNYDASMFEWTADADLPMEKLPNYEKLVYPQWLKNLLDGKTVPNAPTGRFVIVATSTLASPDVFIPGSIFVAGAEWELRGAAGGITYGSGNLWPADELKKNIESWGIDKDTTVIVYYTCPGSPDAIVSARLLWALLYAGVKDVRILNGGIDAWTKNGWSVSATPAARQPVADFGTASGEFPLHPEYLATTEFVEQVVAGTQTNAVMADIRSKQEYVGGENEYLSIGIPLTVVGRIPGAKWGHWGPSTLTGGDYWDAADGSFRNYTEVRQFWKEYGITQDKTVSFYCGTGWRSSLAFFYAYMMGWPKIKNYDGSFFEWSETHPNANNHAIETGWPY